MNELVSVIVPVFKIESFVEKCVESIRRQSYINLEIILVDDGSPDRCGDICNQLAKNDDRIQVIHQDNRGLSGARNSGIEIAQGEYLLFVDGDDYIEPNTVECLLRSCIEYSADVSCCGFYREFTNRSTSHPLTDTIEIYTDDEVNKASLSGSFAYFAWTKLWKRELFDNVRFPVGRNFEDISTIWKVFDQCKKVVCVPDVLFHYVVRKDSISNTKTMKNLLDRWIAFKERYDEMARKSEELNRICTIDCIDDIGYTWRWLYCIDKEERETYMAELQEMRVFLLQNYEYRKYCSKATQLSLFCAKHSNSITIIGCHHLNQVYRRISGRNQML